MLIPINLIINNINYFYKNKKVVDIFKIIFYSNTIINDFIGMDALIVIIE